MKPLELLIWKISNKVKAGGQYFTQYSSVCSFLMSVWWSSSPLVSRNCHYSHNTYRTFFWEYIPYAVPSASENALQRPSNSCFQNFSSNNAGRVINGFFIFFFHFGFCNVSHVHRDFGMVLGDFLRPILVCELPQSKSSVLTGLLN